MVQKAEKKAEKLSRAERRDEVMRLAKRGFSYRKIVEALAQMGIKTSLATVKRDYDAILAELQADTQEEALQARKLDLARLDDAFDANYDGYEKGKVNATAHVFGAIDRRAKLYGYEQLDLASQEKPTQINMNFEVYDRQEGDPPAKIEDSE